MLADLLVGLPGSFVDFVDAAGVIFAKASSIWIIPRCMSALLISLSMSISSNSVI